MFLRETNPAGYDDKRSGKLVKSICRNQRMAPLTAITNNGEHDNGTSSPRLILISLSAGQRGGCLKQAILRVYSIHLRSSNCHVVFFYQALPQAGPPLQPCPNLSAISTRFEPSSWSTQRVPSLPRSRAQSEGLLRRGRKSE